MNDNTPKNPFQNSLNLPKTDFPIRAMAAETEPKILKQWIDEKLYEKSMEDNGNKTFILHDGPPYANGNIHLGTALNKSLKDFVAKSKRMMGHHVPLVLGWDCHGMPIEYKMMKDLGIEQTKDITDRVAFKKLCRDYAARWIETQREEFKDLGVVADWSKPYITMDPAYEASTLRAFAKFVEKGFIERKGKTVPWCATCQTALAGAEIEHKERKDPSCYILFALEREAARTLFPFIFEKNPDLTINLLIWTTTPWTIPLNRAVALHPTAVYSVLQGRTQNDAFVVAKALGESVCKILELPYIELAEFDSVVLGGKKLHHPLVQDLLVPVILEDVVSLTDGTACVHSAPGCGPEDYLMGLKNNLEIYSPLSIDGKYTVGIEPKELEGVSIADGQWWVLKRLGELDRLMHKTSLKHAYPHCWRCRNGLMFRATDQWFCSLQQNNLVKKAVDATEVISFIPDWGKNRLQAFVQTRSEWCISRQRQWGVPIPALLCKACGGSFLQGKFIEDVAAHVEKEGIEFWDRMTPQELHSLGILKDGFACSSCPNKDLEQFKLERDILDVWFDSGVSNFAVLKKDERVKFPADLYLEGSDQHRGWFQSSLFCSLVVNDAPYAKSILTHGYVVDEHKMKMSKSLGNVIAPQDIIKKYSRDILRLWVASSAYENDIVISGKLLDNVAEVYRKIRNTCRFLISNLYDYDHEAHAVEMKELWSLDQYILRKLFSLRDEVLAEYESFHFAAAMQLINNFCTNDLSSEYLDILKDRLYCEQPYSLARRSAQTAMYLVLDMLAHLMAPVLSFLAEEVSGYYLKNKRTSIHLAQMPSLNDMRQGWQALGLNAQEVDAAWKLLVAVRGFVLKELEVLRQAGKIRQSMEAQVELFFDTSSQASKPLIKFLEHVESREGLARFLQDWFIVSGVSIKREVEGLAATECPWVFVAAAQAGGEKCLRCWQWRLEISSSGICNRCGKCV